MHYNIFCTSKNLKYNITVRALETFFLIKTYFFGARVRLQTKHIKILLNSKIKLLYDRVNRI